MLEDADEVVGRRGREALLKFARAVPGGDIAATLASTGDPAMIPRLLDALEGSVDQRRGALGVICALAVFGRSAVGALLQRLERAEWLYRNEIASGLRLIASSGSDLLVAALASDWPHVRAGAAFALAGVPPGVGPVGPLVVALTDPEPEVAAAAATALGEVGDDRAVKPLLEAAQSPHAGIRAAAAWSLGSVGGATVVESLVALLGDEDSGVVVWPRRRWPPLAGQPSSRWLPFWRPRRPPACRVCGCAVGNRDGGVCQAAPCAAIETVACSRGCCYGPRRRDRDGDKRLLGFSEGRVEDKGG